MQRLALALVVMAACGTDQDQRPLTVQYATEAILGPTCGAAECHSSFTQARGDVFDTVDGARRSLVDNGLIQLDSANFSVTDPTKIDFSTEALIVWITTTDPFRRGIGRMPFDAPMPNTDINYLKKFIAAGAPGAACDPDVSATACNNTNLVTCTPDWSFGALVHACASPNETGCSAGACVCGTDFGDCDMNPANGCELQLSTDATCGGCSTSCMGDKHCAVFGQGHQCQCATGSDVCNTGTPNTCVPLNTAQNCGSCGHACTGATPTCALVAGAEVCQ